MILTSAVTLSASGGDAVREMLAVLERLLAAAQGHVDAQGGGPDTGKERRAKRDGSNGTWKRVCKGSHE